MSVANGAANERRFGRKLEGSGRREWTNMANRYPVTAILGWRFALPPATMSHGLRPEVPFANGRNFRSRQGAGQKEPDTGI